MSDTSILEITPESQTLDQDVTVPTVDWEKRYKDLQSFADSREANAKKEISTLQSKLIDAAKVDPSVITELPSNTDDELELRALIQKESYPEFESPEELHNSVPDIIAKKIEEDNIKLEAYISALKSVNSSIDTNAENLFRQKFGLLDKSLDFDTKAQHAMAMTGDIMKPKGSSLPAGG